MSTPGYTRRKELICTEADLTTYGSIVLRAGESIYVLQSDGRYDIKIGDGITELIALPCSVSYSEINDLKVATEDAKTAVETMVDLVDTNTGVPYKITVTNGQIVLVVREQP